jgi:very-short-patch-repair endonuclease
LRDLGLPTRQPHVLRGADRRDDRARTRELIRDGWTVLEFGEDDSVDELVLTVATLLARAAA